MNLKTVLFEEHFLYSHFDFRTKDTLTGIHYSSSVILHYSSLFLKIYNGTQIEHLGFRVESEARTMTA